MLSSRKIFVLGGLALLIGLAGTASAQVAAGAFTCVANAAVPPTLRSEGLTELVGDIVLDCEGGIPTKTSTSIPQVNFTVFLNTNVTSRTYDSSGTSEALLMIDEPGSTTNSSPIGACNSTAGCSITGTGVNGPGNVVVAGPEPYNGGAGRPNVFQGIVKGNQVMFIGVPVDAPGTSGHRIFRITNIRANASGISAGPSGTPGTIQALISASGSTSVPINNPTQVVGFVQSGLAFTLRTRGSLTSTPNTTTDIAFPQCNNLNYNATNNSYVAQWTEAFPGSFKVRAAGVSAVNTAPATSQNIPGSIYNTESGFYMVGSGIPLAGNGGYLSSNIGLADTGTRLKVTINNVPAGVTVYASTGASLVAAGVTPAPAAAITTPAAIALTSGVGPVTTATGDGRTYAGVTSNPFTTAYAGVAVNGSVTFYYEVVAGSSLSSDTYNANIWFSYTGNSAQNSPAPGTATAVGGFAPTPSDMGVSASTAAATSTSLAIPRFIEATLSRAIMTVYVCRTNLLFPFVTNQQGFDTGLAIANTSQDPFGTTVQNGSCNLFSYGANAPASLPTGTIQAGTVYVALASTSMPNFQGYIIAQCSFQFAHGFAFVSDFGARNLAMGYLALVIPEPGVGSRGAQGQGSSAAGSGEGLLN